MTTAGIPGSENSDAKHNEPDIRGESDDRPNGTEPKMEAAPRATRRPASVSKRSSRSPARRTAPKKASGKKTAGKIPARSAPPKFPRHPVERALRIPRAILGQNAGRPASTAEAARFLGGTASGEFQTEVSSAKKYGFLASEAGKLVLTDRAKRALRPQNESDELTAIREAVLDASEISDVYNFYRGEYLPDTEFFINALTERFKIPADKISDFREVFTDSLKTAQLIDESGDRPKLIDIGREEGGRTTTTTQGSTTSRKIVHATTSTDSSCFVMQPFAPPYDGYYETLLKPAIQQAGLRPVRADDEIFGSGKIMDQVWRGIRDAKILVAELTTRNANVYYELGLAHALGKPVVLVAADGEDVPFDVHHIRVIYYDITDPFWGQKLVDKIAENIQSALANPEEAVLAVPDKLYGTQRAIPCTMS